MLHALEIAGMGVENNVFLAPMAGYTNAPFRAMCANLGAGLAFTEMVSAKGLHYQNEDTKLLLYHANSLPPTGGGSRVAGGGGDKRPTLPTGGGSAAGGGGGDERPALPTGGGSRVAGGGGDERPALPTGRGSRVAGGGGDKGPALSTGGGSAAGGRRPLAAQIFGSDPDIMREACESEFLADFDLIDINMGCPMPKIVKNGEGSALLETPALAEKVIASCVKSGKRISVKFRVGIDENRKICAEFAKLCEGAGACMIEIHGRTREQIYAGPVDYDSIAAAKAAVKIPVIANGGIWNRRDMEKMLSRTGADGVMVARAALYRPQVFCELTGREIPPIRPLFLRQLRETAEIYGERFSTVYMRKMAAFYMKGTRRAAEAKRRFFAAQSTAELASLAEEMME